MNNKTSEHYLDDPHPVDKKFTAVITTNKMMNNEKPLSWVKFSAIQLANPLD